MLSTVFAVGLALVAQTKEEAPAKKYTIDTSKTTAEVKAGQSGMFALKIQAAPGYHVSTEAPLKIGLEATGIKLHKTTLATADAKDPKAESPEFGVKFGAESAGAQQITADATFFVCDVKICERQKEKIVATVQVKP
jgi:hypothetical protein